MYNKFHKEGSREWFINHLKINPFIVNNTLNNLHTHLNKSNNLNNHHHMFQSNNQLVVNLNHNPNMGNNNKIWIKILLLVLKMYSLENFKDKMGKELELILKWLENLNFRKINILFKMIITMMSKGLELILLLQEVKLELIEEWRND